MVVEVQELLRVTLGRTIDLDASHTDATQFRVHHHPPHSNIPFAQDRVHLLSLSLWHPLYHIISSLRTRPQSASSCEATVSGPGNFTSYTRSPHAPRGWANSTIDCLRISGLSVEHPSLQPKHVSHPTQSMLIESEQSEDSDTSLELPEVLTCLPLAAADRL
jgi:hypothetical protein